MHIRSLILASLSVLAMTSASFAGINGGCTDYVEVTENNAPVNRLETKPGSTSNAELDSRGARLSAACQPGSDHPWATGMQRAGGACDRMASLKSLSDPSLGGLYRPYVTYDGNVDDIETHRNYIQIGPIKIYGPEQDGACGS